ncbi:MAG: transcriptional repressor [Candidatus Fimenecus sp.]
MPQVRKSRQRDAILQNLQQRFDHPTAMELYLSVREEIPSLSLGTLYRNLNTLCENGTIVRFSSGGEEHYDADTHRHAHLQCEKCGRFYDLPQCSLPSTEALLSTPFCGEVHDYSLIFFGVCTNCCAQAEQNKKENF